MTSVHFIQIVSFVLIMLFKLCHHSVLSHSSTFKINNDPTDSYHALQAFSKSFSRDSLSNFSIFHLINQNGKTSLFVVCRNDTIIQIAIENMEMVNIYRQENCTYSVKYKCHDNVAINLLSDINFLNQKMIWFCYVLPHNNYPSPSLTHCMVPKNNVLIDDVRWTKTGYSSTSNIYRTFAVQTKPYIFIGSYTTNSLLILRTKLPNVIGFIDSSEDLMTPMAEFYFERNSHFLEVFATKYDVYYVVEEPLTAKSHSIPECLATTDTRTVISTRLIRICKDDPGGVYQFNENNFGTAAKADIVCPVGIGSERYHYTRSISASWSGDKLYLLFESQKNAPGGKVLCVYDVLAFNVAFNSEMIPPAIFLNVDRINSKIDNPIEDLCKKLSEKSLNEKQKLEASSISTNGLYRSKNILPIKTVPLLKLRHLSYNAISTFTLSKYDSTTVIVLIADNFIRLLSHMDNDDVCHIQDFQFEKSETINQVKGDNIKSKVFVYISTNKRMVQLELSMCEKFLEEQECLMKAPRICGWDSRRQVCMLLTEEIDLSRWQRSSCTHIRVDDIWSLAEKCQVKNEQVTMSCTCRYCLEEAGCPGEKRIDITNCSGAENVDSYENWSSWSECSQSSEYQSRTRKCTASKCTGENVDFRKCEISRSSVTTTNWTKWYQSLNPKYYVSFRAKCPINQLLPPTIEEREKFCGRSCSDDSLTWSSWSECSQAYIQYRLYNCTSFDVCHHTRTDVKSCAPNGRKYLQGDTEGGYSILHIVLAILIASLVWLLIVILVSLFLFRNHRKNKRKSRKPENVLRPKIFKNVPSSRSIIQQHSITSETSNDYLNSTNPSHSYHPTFAAYSFQSSNDDGVQSNNTIYSRIPIRIDEHADIVDQN